MHLDFRCLCSVGLGLALAGGILLGVFGSLLIRPYMYAKDFDKVTCSVQSNSLVANVCCVADVSMQECSDWYPCLRILVSYSGDTIVTTNGVLFQDHESVAYQKNNSTCSMFHCPVRSYAEALEEVTRFQTNYGAPGQNFQCYRDPDQTNEVLLEVISSNQLTNGLLWPSLALLIGLVMAILAYCRVFPCARQDMEKEGVDLIIVPDEVKAFTPPATPSFGSGSPPVTPTPSMQSQQERVTREETSTDVVVGIQQDTDPDQL